MQCWTKIGKLVNDCEHFNNANERFITRFRKDELINEVQQGEELRLRKQIENFAYNKAAFLKEILYEKHKERVQKSQIKREVYESHKIGIGDPSRLAAYLEKRLYFKEHIKVDVTGKKPKRNFVLH